MHTFTGGAGRIANGLPWVALIVLSCSIGLAFANESQDSGTTYGVIVDCGSSGTRANIYHWSNTLMFPILLNDIEPLRNETTKAAIEPLKKTPGLSSMRDEPDKSSLYMKEIFQFITDNIPKESQSATGIYIMATAGMRLLDGEIQEEIMNDIAKDITQRFNFAEVKTSVISGAQEGMYQWISVNSKAKRFTPAMEPTRKKVEVKKPYALIEMGGASIQVAYLLQPGLGREILLKLPKNSGAQPAFVSQIVEPNISRQLESHKYELHSTTFLGLGSNSARDNYLDMLIKPSKRLDERFGRYIMKKVFKSNTSEKRKQPVLIKDPCMPLGSSEETLKPTRMLSRKETKTLGFIQEKEDEEMFSVKVVGTGNYAKCRAKVSEFLKLCKKDGLHCKPEEPCTMHLLGTPFVPFDSYEFLGLGEFYYSTLSMMKLDGVYKHDEIVEKTREMCELPIDELERKYPDANKFDSTRSKSECFKAVFVDTFLTEGLMMPTDYGNLQTVGKVNKESVDWTLGAVLDQSLSIEEAAEREGDDEDDEIYDDDDDFQEYIDAEEAEQEAEFEEKEVQKALQDDGDNQVHALNADAAEVQASPAEQEERPHFGGGDLSDEQAVFEMDERLAEAERDNEKLVEEVHIPKEMIIQEASSSEAALNNQELDDDLAELELAERYPGLEPHKIW